MTRSRRSSSSLPICAVFTHEQCGAESSGYIPALDGLRAVAVLVVAFAHAHVGPAFLRVGSLGVDVFFVLSGFLITRLLLQEISKTGRLEVKRFYLHRFARLTPPLLLMLALYLALASLAWPAYPHHLRDAFVSSLYLSDYGVALWGVPKYLRHTWSLAVEEHFYLLWPLVLLLFRATRPAVLLAVLAGLYLLATAWRFYCAETQGWNLTYYRFDTRLSGLMLGSLLAVLLSQPWRGFYRHRQVGLLLLLVGLTAGLVASTEMGWRHIPTLQSGILIIELASALVILAAVNRAGFVAWLGWQPLAYVGRLSYGIYLFHYPIMVYARQTYDSAMPLWLGFACAVLLAALSYHTIEARVRRWRKARQATQAASPALSTFEATAGRSVSR